MRRTKIDALYRQLLPEDSFRFVLAGTPEAAEARREAERCGKTLRTFTLNMGEPGKGQI